MKKLSTLFVLAALLCAAPASAQDYAACVVSGVVKICPGNVRLKGVSTLALANIPTMDVAHLPIVTEAKGGFGADVSGLGTGYLKRTGAATWTAASIPAGDLPSGIDPLKIGAGLVSSTVFGYLANVSSDIQTQLNGKQATLTLPLSKANGGFGADVSTGLTNNFVAYVTGGALVIGALPVAAIASALAAGGNPITGTIVDASVRMDTPTIGTNSSNQHALPSGTGALLSADSLPLSEANGGFGANVSGLGTGFLRRSGAASYSASNVVVADIAAALAAGGNPINGTTFTASVSTITPTIGPSGGSQHALPSGTGDLLDANSSLGRGNISTALTAGGTPVNGTTFNAATYIITPSIGPTTVDQHGIPNSGTDFIVTTDATQTLVNKTYSAPTLSGSVGGTYTLAGAPTLGASVTTTDGSYNLGDATHRLAQVGAVSLLSGASTLNLTSSVVDGSSAIGAKIYNVPALSNATARIASFGSNATEKAAFLANGGLIAPTVGPVATQQHTLPAVTSDTVALLAASQTLTNKTVSGASNTLTNISPSSLTATGTAGTYAVPMSMTTTAQGLVAAVTAGAAPLTATLSGSFTVTHTDGTTFDNTGVSVTLPGAGTYVIVWQVRSILTSTTLGCTMISRLFDSTNSVEVTSGGTGGGAAGATNSGRLEGAFVLVSGVNTQNTATGVLIYTVTGSTTIRIEAVASAAATTKTINTDANGATNIVAWQVR